MFCFRYSSLIYIALTANDRRIFSTLLLTVRVGIEYFCFRGSLSFSISLSARLKRKNKSPTFFFSFADGSDFGP